MSEISNVLSGNKELDNSDAFVSVTYWPEHNGLSISVYADKDREHAEGMIEMTWEQWYAVKELVDEMNNYQPAVDQTPQREGLF